MKPIFTGTVSRGAIKFDNPEIVNRYIKPWEGKPIELTVAKRLKPRSLKANKYYWGVIVALIADYCGYTAEETHDSLKAYFSRDNAFTAKLPKVKSTSTMNVAEFCDYCEKIKQWAAEELNIFIPDAEKVDL